MKVISKVAFPRSVEVWLKGTLKVMGGKRRSCGALFREGVVWIVLETGESAAVVAWVLGVHEGTLQRWVHRAEARAAAEAAGGLGESECEELRRLREESGQLREENTEMGVECDVLRRSVVFWVEEAMK